MLSGNGNLRVVLVELELDFDYFTFILIFRQSICFSEIQELIYSSGIT